jgi:hypothetical protein
MPDTARRRGVHSILEGETAGGVGAGSVDGMVRCWPGRPAGAAAAERHRCGTSARHGWQQAVRVQSGVMPLAAVVMADGELVLS